MTNIVRTVNVPLLKPDINEIRRYANCKSGADKLIEECIEELSLFQGKACYFESDIKLQNGEIDMGFAKTTSKSLYNLLEGCEKIVVFCATIGLLPDKLIAKYSKISPSKSVILQAISTERIEAVCDKFCNMLKEDYKNGGYSLTDRFSPGYGDLPLDLQRKIFAVLNCQKNIGVTLNDSLLMMPSKSVTAIIGVKK